MTKETKGLKEDIRRTLQEGGPATAAQLAQSLGLRVRDIAMTLTEMGRSGSLVSLGPDKRRVYHLPSQVAAVASDRAVKMRPFVPLGPLEAAPLRPGALDHVRCGSLRCGRVVPYSPPVGMLA